MQTMLLVLLGKLEQLLGLFCLMIVCQGEEEEDPTFVGTLMVIDQKGKKCRDLNGERGRG
jgi:hypothetical protein